MEQLYIIWSWEHSGWWGEASNGYVYNRKNAGQYTYKEALDICLGANRSFYRDETGKKMPNEAMVPVSQD